MIAATIGRTFLETYKKRTYSTISAKSFFEEIYVPLFFDHPKYMMTGGNSPLENPKISWKKGITPSSEEREERISNTIKEIESQRFDGSIAIGFSASEDTEFAKYSGQTTNIELPYNTEDKYLSWIGSGFGICLKGALSIYFEEEEILWQIFEGWKHYREFLNDVSIPKFRGNQIEAWNAQWLNFSFNDRLFREDFDFSYLHEIGVFNVDASVVEVKMLKWTNLFFSLSNKFPEKKQLGYIYSLGPKGNTTIGFTPFYFNSATRLKKLYIKLFGENSALNNASKYEEIFGLEFRRACSFGVIGLKALEPSTLRDKYGNLKELKLTKPKPQKDEETNKKVQEKDYENIIKFQTYKTWLLAMITKNKEENLKYSEEVAKVLLAHKQEARVEKKQIEEKLFKAKGRKQFLIELNELIKVVSDDNTKVLKDLSNRAYLLNDEDFQYLFILIKIEFTYQERLANQ
ncbi:hypothetical protein [Sunxiuqinia sp. sy24]|uniref:hypothetical protein n=1 Tax=Sunxiuqinia sp. sy24 TaxID=3461495 RepID=UPI0040453B04